MQQEVRQRRSRGEERKGEEEEEQTDKIREPLTEVRELQRNMTLLQKYNVSIENNSLGQMCQLFCF